jgi:VWFA-related protein
MPRRSPILVLFLLCSTALAAAAQQTTPSHFGEEIEVRVINVDVVVTDRNGKPMMGLERKDFELYENGRRVEITYFSRVSEGRLDGQPVASDAGEPISDPSPQETASETPPVTWIVYVDQGNIRPGQRNAVLRQLSSFLSNSMKPGDRGLSASFDGVAFRVQGGFAEREVLLRTVGTLEKERVHYGPEFRERTSIRRDIEEAAAAPILAGPVMNAVAVLVEAEATRTYNTIRAMRSLLDAIAGAEGRLALIYVGAGFNTLPAMETTEIFRQRLPWLANNLGAPRPENHKPKLEQEVTSVFDRISATRATLYTIYAGDSAFLVSGPEYEGSLDTGGGIVGETTQLTQMGLAREMAERTGGRFFKASPELASQLRTVGSDLSHYYSLGYRPTGRVGTARTVRVSVKAEGARVRHRETVRERTTSEESSDAVVAALFESAPSNPLGVSLEAGQPRSAGLRRGQIVPVTIRIPLADVGFIAQGEMHQGSLQFHFAVAGEDGTLVRLGERELPLSIPDAELAEARQHFVSYSVDVPVAGNRTRLAVSVQDRVSQTTSMAEIHLAPQGNP